MDAVVAHVTHAAQHHALWKAARAQVVAGPQLPEYGDQRVANQGVDLVDQQHQWSRVGHAPAGQRFAESVMGAGPRKYVGPYAVQELVPQGMRTRGEPAQNGAHGVLHVLTRCLRWLDVHVHAAVLTDRTTVQQVLEREQDRGLARLPGRMQHEVPLVPHELQNLAEIHPFKRRDAVVVLGDDRTFGVESAHGSKYGTQAFEWRRCRWDRNDRRVRPDHRPIAARLRRNPDSSENAGEPKSHTP